MKMKTTTTDTYYVIKEKTVFDEQGNPSLPLYYVAPAPEGLGDEVVAGPFKSYTEALDDGLEKTLEPLK